MWQGNMCYMRNGQPYAAGLVQIGSDIYYVRSSCQAATGMYWVSPGKTNGILKTGFYLFADNGARIDGRFADWKGEEGYIKMGQPYYAGVIEYNGKLFYVGSDCKLNTGVCYITRQQVMVFLKKDIITSKRTENFLLQDLGNGQTE